MIVDDFEIPVCQRAIRHFFERHGLNMNEFVDIDRSSAYWKKSANPPLKMEMYQSMLLNKNEKAA